jgi:hypothetical protein
MVHRPDRPVPAQQAGKPAGRASSTEPGAGSAETNGLENGWAFNQTGPMPTYRLTVPSASAMSWALTGSLVTAWATKTAQGYVRRNGLPGVAMAACGAGLRHSACLTGW